MERNRRLTPPLRLRCDNRNAAAARRGSDWRATSSRFAAGACVCERTHAADPCALPRTLCGMSGDAMPSSSRQMGAWNLSPDREDHGAARAGCAGRKRFRIAGSDPRRHDETRRTAARPLRHDEPDTTAVRCGRSGGGTGREDDPDRLGAGAARPREVLVPALAKVRECETGLLSAHVWDRRVGVIAGVITASAQQHADCRYRDHRSHRCGPVHADGTRGRSTTFPGHGRQATSRGLLCRSIAASGHRHVRAYRGAGYGSGGLRGPFALPIYDSPSEF